MNKTNIIAAVVTGMVLVFVALGIVYFQNRTTDDNFYNIEVVTDGEERPQTSWVLFDVESVNGVKTYTNESVGVSFKYPEEYVVFGVDVDEEYFIEHNQYSVQVVPEGNVTELLNCFNNPSCTGTGAMFVHVNVAFDKISSDQTLEDWYYEDYVNDFFLQQRDREEVLAELFTYKTVAGADAIEYFVDGLMNYHVISLKYNGWIISINYPTDTHADDHNLEETFNFVLNSLELTE